MSTANQFGTTIQGSGNPAIYEFGPFVLDTGLHALLKKGKAVPLTPKTYDTLLVLVQNSGRMLPKEELMKALWPDSFVEEANLTQQVSLIRRALADSSTDPKYIETVSGRGYRFAAAVRHREGKPSPNFSPGAPLDDVDRQQGISPELGIRPKDAVPAAPVPATLPAPLSAPSIAPLPAALPAPLIANPDPQKKWARVSGIEFTRILAIAVFIFGIAAALFLWHSLRSHPATKVRSLAVLPLHNLKGDAADDFLSYSLADAIITKLDYVSSLTTRPSATIEKYRNQVIDIPKVAADLNVEALLIGGFVHDGDDLRITYQLVEGKSAAILDRGAIDLKYDKLLKVQDTVAQKVIADLRLDLSPSEAEKLKAAAPVSPLAYEYYLRGVDLHSQHKFPLAIKMLEKSTEIDANYAPAWAYLGASYTSDAAFEFGGQEQYRRAQAAYERALAIQPAQLEAQIFLANFLVDTGKVEQAVPLLRDALKTNPNNADLHWELGYAYRFAGMLNESLAECERALQIDPFLKANGSALNTYLYLGEYDQFLASLPQDDPSAFFLFYRGFGEYHLKNWSRAVEDFDRAFELDPSILYTQVGKALGDSITNHKAAGLEILGAAESRIRERGVGDPEASYKIAQTYAVLGDKASALRALRSSIEGGFFSYPYLSRDPLLDPLRNEPEFKAILSMAQQRYEAFRKQFFETGR